MLEFDDLMLGDFSPSREMSLFGTNNDAFLVPSVGENPFLYETEKSAAGDFNHVVNGNPEQQQIANVYDFFSQQNQDDFSNEKLFDTFAADSNLNATGTESLFFEDSQAGLNDELTWLCDSLDLESIGASIFDPREQNEPNRPSSSAKSPMLAELAPVPAETPKSSMDIFEEIVRESEAFSPGNTSRMEEMEDMQEAENMEGSETSLDGFFYSPAETPQEDHQGYMPQYLVQATGSDGQNFMIAVPANMQIPVTEGTIIQLISTATANFGSANRKTTKIMPAVASIESEEESRGNSPATPSPGPTRGKIKYWNAKERKRAQNREAAQRYRQKKKNEKETRMTEMERLEHRNRQLKLKVSDLDREVGYFKSLISEIQAAAI